MFGEDNVNGAPCAQAGSAETKQTEPSGEFAPLLKLKAGERYMLVVMSSMGIGTCAFPMTLIDSRLTSYAQYTDSVELTFRRKRDRIPSVIRFHGSKRFAVFNGWAEVDTEGSAPR